MKTRPEIVYHYRGPIERGADYHWTEGYSRNSVEGGILYPWMTKAECRHDAKALGGKATFDEKGTGR